MCSNMGISFKLAVLLSIVGGCLASECCDSYFDSNYNLIDSQWCSDYCCGNLLTGGLTCCSSLILQAPLSDRSDICVLWWKHHIWAPILIVVGNILILACCCFCCYKCCCARRDTTIVYQQQPGGMMPGVTIQQMSQSQQSQQSTMSNGYDQPRY